MAKRIAFKVHGKVQGVAFRDFTQRRATSYGVTGFVFNTSDGKVAGEAQGDEEALKKLKADLKAGPRAAHVVKLEIKDIDVKDGEESFDVSV
ncbi:acylphosphatase [Cladophialophora psammophila CBS 110553]|uniref:acylphosphatase n=1 Tax=Cladophialophora psammophila CBS 110553 TaxID=1182543 RepID=W9WXG9_9EURO|nr:acylphosphatase [Cladophialophora psammophila CBS 110553]EXJ72663.1 acylphosphatase [Cladophialophora psammophila CBS 110553]